MLSFIAQAPNLVIKEKHYITFIIHKLCHVFMNVKEIVDSVFSFTIQKTGYLFQVSQTLILFTHKVVSLSSVCTLTLLSSPTTRCVCKSNLFLFTLDLVEWIRHYLQSSMSPYFPPLYKIVVSVLDCACFLYTPSDYVISYCAKLILSPPFPPLCESVGLF